MKSNIVKDDLYFMKEALKEAKKAYALWEVPVGCVIVMEGKIIARAHNLRETKQNPLAHAEILAINKAAKKLKTWRLEGASLYVTLEPCLMCAGAINQARIQNLYFGIKETKAGAAGSYLNAFGSENLFHVNVYSGYLVEEITTMMSGFFKELRQKKTLH